MKKFSRFQKVKVIDVMKFQNSDKKLPLWLIVRYWGDKGFYVMIVRLIILDIRIIILLKTLTKEWDEKTIL